MMLTPDKSSEGATRASTHDSTSESGIDPNEAAFYAEGGLKKAISQYFASLASTSDTHHGVPVCWNAGAWNAHSWEGRNMEEEVTQLFSDLGLEDNMKVIKDKCLNVFPGRRVNGIWLALWNLRMDRDAKNGRLALSLAHGFQSVGVCWLIRMRSM
jgi:hypothetical protein